jgi:hypothetical protein
MSSETIKTLAIGLISPANRPVHHEGLLDAALRSAIATYSATQPCLTAEAYSCAGQPATDEQGACMEYQVPLSSGAAYAVMITIAGEQYKHRLIYASATEATLRIYGAPSETQALTIWRPAAHDPAIPTWPPHHEALIALMAASFYLNALSLQEPDAQRAELIQSLAASYYGRAATTLSQIS